MGTYVAQLRLDAADGAELVERIEGTKLDSEKGEGIVSIAAYPDAVAIPPEMQAVHPGVPPPIKEKEEKEKS
jgi:hypothetical protein